MPLGPGLGFTPLDSIALSAFQASLFNRQQGSSTIPWTKTGFPIPQHDKSSPDQYRRTVDAALSKMHILDSDPSLKFQHTLTQQLTEQRSKSLYDSLDPPPSRRRIVDSAMEKHAEWCLAQGDTYCS